MKRRLVLLAAAMVISAAAQAADVGPVVTPMEKWFIKAGGSYVMPDSAGTYPVAPLAGAKITAGNVFTGTIEIGRFINDRLSVSVIGGIPPAHELYRDGIDSGKTVTLGAFAIDGQFHLINTDRFDAYVGGGVAYNVYFSTTNPLITSIDNGFAPVLQAGMEYKVSRSIGMFVDVKKEFYTATVHVAGPAAYQERLDPLVVTTGLAFHF